MVRRYRETVRTTLDIDDRVLALARSRARDRGISLGRAVSDLALAGLEADRAPEVEPGRFPVLPAVPGHVITDEMVEAALADDE